MADFDTTVSQKKNFKEVYLRLLKYSLNYKYLLILSFIFLIIFSLTNAGFLSLIKNITDKGFSDHQTNSISLLPLSIISLMAIRALANFITSYSMRWVSRKIIEDLRFDIFKSIMFLPTYFFDKNAAGNIVSKLTYETEILSGIVIKVTLDVIKDLLTLIAVIGYMIYLDPLLTLIFSFVLPLIFLYLKKISPKLRQAGKHAQITMGDMTRVSEESIAANKIVKIFGSQEYELKRFTFYSERNRKMQTKLAKLSGGNSFFVEIISGLALALIVFYSLQHLSAGEFTAFAAALLMILSPIKRLTGINEQLQVGFSAASNIFNVIDEEKESSKGRLILNKIKGSIEFINVSFKYPGSTKKVLNNISFKINAGEKVALVGKSGGGKSTIINLLGLFYENYIGTINLDGLNIKEIKLSNLRDKIGLVNQDIILFNDSIKNNIGYGKTFPIEKIVAAAKAANASEFIDRLALKYEHMIGDRGVKLSGGQKQRIAIARAILKDSPILLLDEATSALDSESEMAVQKALDNLMKNRTSIVVAHRLSTVMNADKIIVIDDGKVIEVGNHKQLLAKKSFYANLYKKGLN